MNEAINWVAHYNNLIIQVVFSIVLILILIYVYRLFFVASPLNSNPAEGTVDLTDVNQKLNQLLEQQKIQPASQLIDKAADSQSAADPALQSEINQLKEENTKLKIQLNESEKKVFELAPTGASSAAEPSVEKALNEEKSDNSQQVEELNKKINELQSRLSEYDIITDDIAELSQLRAENAELKKKSENQLEQVLANEPVKEVLDVETALAEIENIQPAVVEPAAAIEPLAAFEEPVLAAEPPAAEVEEVVNEVVNVTAVTDQNIPEIEKKLMGEFEKSIQKG